MTQEHQPIRGRHHRGEDDLGTLVWPIGGDTDVPVGDPYAGGPYEEPEPDQPDRPDRYDEGRRSLIRRAAFSLCFGAAGLVTVLLLAGLFTADGGPSALPEISEKPR